MKSSFESLRRWKHVDHGLRFAVVGLFAAMCATSANAQTKTANYEKTLGDKYVVALKLGASALAERKAGSTPSTRLRGELFANAYALGFGSPKVAAIAEAKISKSSPNAANVADFKACVKAGSKTLASWKKKKVLKDYVWSGKREKTFYFTNQPMGFRLDLWIFTLEGSLDILATAEISYALAARPASAVVEGNAGSALYAALIGYLNGGSLEGGAGFAADVGGKIDPFAPKLITGTLDVYRSSGCFKATEPTYGFTWDKCWGSKTEHRDL